METCSSEEPSLVYFILQPLQIKQWLQVAICWLWAMEAPLGLWPGHRPPGGGGGTAAAQLYHSFLCCQSMIDR